MCEFVRVTKAFHAADAVAVAAARTHVHTRAGTCTRRVKTFIEQQECNLAWRHSSPRLFTYVPLAHI